MVSGDRDLYQLVDDAKPVRLLYVGKGVANLDVCDNAAVQAKYGVSAAEYADFAALRGDPSDGLPGVPGVGEKTAARLIATHGSLAAIVAASTIRRPDSRPGCGRSSAAATDYLAVAPKVVAVARDVTLPKLDTRLPTARPDAIRSS